MKNWLIEVGIKKFGPSAIRAAIAALTAWILTNQGMLETLGIFYDKGAQIISIHLDTVSGALDVGLFALIGGLIKIINYHAKEALPKKEN